MEVPTLLQVPMQLSSEVEVIAKLSLFEIMVRARLVLRGRANTISELAHVLCNLGTFEESEIEGL